MITISGNGSSVTCGVPLRGEKRNNILIRVLGVTGPLSDVFRP